MWRRAHCGHDHYYTTGSIIRTGRLCPARARAKSGAAGLGRGPRPHTRLPTSEIYPNTMFSPKKMETFLKERFETFTIRIMYGFLRRCSRAAVTLFQKESSMSNEGKKYKCEICGNVVELLVDGGGELVCCGEAMQETSE